MSEKKRMGMPKEMYLQAIVDAFRKLDPRYMIKNPVMFVVEIGSILTAILWVIALSGNGNEETWFVGAVAVWLWFTVLFANFPEATPESKLALIRQYQEEGHLVAMTGDVPCPFSTERDGTLPADSFGGHLQRPDYRCSSFRLLSAA